LVEVIEDQEVEAVTAIGGRFQFKLAARHLKPLHEVGGAREQHAPAVLHQGKADGRSKVRFSAAMGADDSKTLEVVVPRVTAFMRMSRSSRALLPWRSPACAPASIAGSVGRVTQREFKRFSLLRSNLGNPD
jgi:hypothetical protein